MAMLQEQIQQLIEPTVESLGFELWGLQIISGQRQTLRVFIDSPNGIDVDDCAKVSRQIGAILDVEDPISADYVLEVSSPGMDRFLFSIEHYKKYIGANMKLRLKVPFSGRRNYTGKLVSIENEDEIVIQVDNEEYVLPFDSIDKGQVLV